MRAPRFREPVVAGTFYPSDPHVLRAALESYLRDATSGPSPDVPPKALVVPHAGYAFSAAVAASAYARVLAARGRVERVVLVGPAHRMALSAVAAPGADAFVTPLGVVPVDTAARRELVGTGRIVVSDEAHAAEHSLEVQLPFLQVALGDFAVLPLVVGQVPADSVADVLDSVWGSDETLIVVSTDLSHYHDHATATELDRRTAAAIVARQPEALGPGDACGFFPLRGLLAAARRHELGVELLDLRSSADASGGTDRVVGYGAFALAGERPAPTPLGT